MTPPPRRRVGVLVWVALVALGLSSPPRPVGADPIDEKRAEAARLQAQLEEQGDRVSVAAERFNRAQVELSEVRTSLARARDDLERSQGRAAEARDRLADAAVAAYVGGGGPALLSRLARTPSSDMVVVRRQYLRITSSDQQRLIGEMRAATEDLTLLQGRLSRQERVAKEVSETAAAHQRSAESAEAAQRTLLGRAQGDLATLVAAEAARREAEAARAVPPALVSPVAASAPSAALQPAARAAPVPTSSKGAVAVAEAERQIGKPYVYGGSGPDSFDCSGLTAWAWRAAGVRLSHSAYTQWFETTRVPIDQIQPGDLLFFGNDGVESIHHNAIYIGNGQMVEASQTGVPIRYRGWRAGDLVGAGRPG